MTTMNSSRPYLVSAIHDWIVDNNCTPYILVDATHPHAQVPNEYVQDGRIVLNISPTAVMSLSIGPDALEFGGRFSGVARSLYVPMEALLGIYARENGQGMLFNGNEPIISSGSTEVGAGSDAEEDGVDVSSLDGTEGSADLFSEKPKSKDESKARLSSVTGKSSSKASKATEDSDGDEPPTPSGGGKAKNRPSLKVVK